ncbi:MAG: VOC family protein [Chlorobi bacterium]|nr:VOC family protein [Chlorobiota bacterium]
MAGKDNKKRKPNSKSPEYGVSGIGGIFFKCKDPEKMKAWYKEHLGFKTDKFGSLFEWRESLDPDHKAYTSWNPFSENSHYFAPSEKEYMINYRVRDLKKLLEKLGKEGVEIMGKMETFEYGRFAWIIDPEGNKIELWEPVDEVFTDMYRGKTIR